MVHKISSLVTIVTSMYLDPNGRCIEHYNGRIYVGNKTLYMLARMPMV
jgi:hypothetical protein